MPNYGDQKYWEDRYKSQKGTCFDWLEDYNQLKEVLNLYLKPTDKILVIGCGNAKISEEMYDAGFKNQWNIDISHTVIS